LAAACVRPIALPSQLLTGRPTNEGFLPDDQDSLPGPRRAQSLGRRESLGAVSSSLAALSLAEISLPAAAEDAAPPIPPRGWQLKLPEDWVKSKQAAVPGPEERRTKELLLAGNAAQDAEVRVLRVPLVTSERDPQGLGSLALIEYFTAATPRVSREQILPVLTSSWASQPATFSLTMAGQALEKVRGGQKYLMYEFDLTRCEGAQVEGIKGKVCQKDNGEVLPTAVRHHAIMNTVTAEPSKGEANEVNYPEVLWIIDVSAPADKWPQLSSQVSTLLQSFAVGTNTQLEAVRNATNTLPA
ncbi:unnamed protein product, partial [Polarella glacialis]